MGIPTIDYKGFLINYDEDKDDWYIRGQGDDRTETLKKMKEKVDKILKSKLGGIKVLRQRYDGLEEYTLISRDEKGDFWIKDKNGSRTKVPTSTLYRDCPENINISKEIQDLKKQIGKIHYQISKKGEELKHFELKGVDNK